MDDFLNCAVYSTLSLLLMEIIMAGQLSSAFVELALAPYRPKLSCYRMSLGISNTFYRFAHLAVFRRFPLYDSYLDHSLCERLHLAA